MKRCGILNSAHFFSYTAVSSADYVEVTALTRTFSDGDVSGDTVCIDVTIMEDMLVECEHSFSVLLNLVTANRNIMSGNRETEVTITDNDGAEPFDTFPLQALTLFCILADATISLTAVESVGEMDSDVEVCATLSTDPGVTLEKSITVMLETADNTG